jgi:LPXTG-site transpeptidase (sortase) family protein
MLFWAALLTLKPFLASPRLDSGNYLLSASKISLPLPRLSSIRTPEATPEDVFFSLVHNPFTPTPTATPTPTPTPIPAGPVIRVVISSINVDRAVVPLRQYRDNSGQVQYDTNSLFATSSRLDVVGRTLTSGNPGSGGNIVLVGHNYNMGWYAWEGVFVNLDQLKVGDKIVLYTENGGKFKYYVKKVVEVPYLYKTAAELNRHLNYLGPTRDERVTMVTCGGPFGVWSARIYVVAK